MCHSGVDIEMGTPRLFYDIESVFGVDSQLLVISGTIKDTDKIAARGGNIRFKFTLHATTDLPF